MAPRVSYSMPAHLAVMPDIAPRLDLLLRDTRRRFRRGEFGTPDERLLVWFDQLEKLAADTLRDRPASFTSNGLPVDRWIPTAVVAERLGITERAVRSLPLSRKKVRGNLVWHEGDVDDEVEARRYVLRNAAEGSGSADAA